MAILGGLLAIWMIAAISWTTSLGVRDGFMTFGPCRLTRDPQCLRDDAVFLSLSIIANSPILQITHAVLALAFITVPHSEEDERYWRTRRAFWEVLSPY